MQRQVLDGDAGYGGVVLELSSLISNYPPPFIYVHDSETLKSTTNVFGDLLTNLASTPSPSSSEGEGPTTKVCFGRADALCCFNQRLFFEAIINTLVDSEADWGGGCPNWEGERTGVKWNENIDSFIQGLRAVHAYLCLAFGSNPGSRNAKTKGTELQFDGVRLVLMVERAEKLKDAMSELLVPLARLQELARIDLTILFVSEVRWDNIKPPLGAAPDPYFIDIPALTRENIINIMVARFPFLASQDRSLYHPSLESLYSHFVAVLCDVCHPYTHDPCELEYIAAARWPGFVKPVLDDHTMAMNFGENNEGDQEIPPPSEDVRLRLMRIFTSSLSLALEALYPRLTNASDWAKANEPVPDLLTKSPMQAKVLTANPPLTLGTGSLLGHLPRLSKFILVASFLASTNPAKSDLRTFGRGLDEKKRRRKAHAPLKPKGGVSKVPQRFLGPSPFPLDRLISILGSLLEEHDVENLISAPEFTIPGEYTEMEISRVTVYASVQELASSHLMHRTTKAEHIDGPPMFKSATSHELALVLAKELKIPLPDLLWEQL